MYRALYAFRSPEPNSLLFGAGESFLILERSNQHWWLASRCSSGETGYVPASYLERIQVQEQDQVLQSIDRAIETIHNAAMKNGGKYNLEQRDVLQKLIHHRKETQTRKNHSPSAHSNSITTSSSEHHLESARQSNGVCRTERHMSLPNPEFQLEDASFYQIPPQPRRAAPVTPPPPEKQKNLQNALCTQNIIDKSSRSISNASNPSISSLDTLCTSSTDSVHNTTTSSPCNTPPPVPTRSAHTRVSQGVDPSSTSATTVPNSHTKQAAPGPPSQIQNPCESGQTTQTKRNAPAPPPNIEAFNSINSDTKVKASLKSVAPESPTHDAVTVPKTIGAELIELVRKNTNLSYELSRVAIGVIVGHIQASVPSTASAMEQILVTLVESKDSGAGLPSGQVCHDEQRLEVIFADLARHKDDAQQRSWALYEDENVILCYLEELLLILTDADPEVCKRMCKRNHFEAVLSLVAYYQMEHRVPLRLLLLKCFGAMCNLDASIISALVNSVLPMELARDMQTHTQEHQKMCYSALVLAMIFSMGEPLPYHHYEHLNSQFVQFLLEVIEDGLPSDITEQLPDLFINVLLAFNLHIPVPANNVIMKTLVKQPNVKVFTEKLLLIFNRGDDPVAIFKHQPQPPHSVLKILQDVFASKDTAHLFYHTDMMVMIDIIVRQIADLSPGDKLRMEYLSLMHAIIRSTDYLQHAHRQTDLHGILQRILSEEEAEPHCQMDKIIIMEIYKEFPQMADQAS
ncbi:NCK-interacting protein with SH3 domain [Xenopus tropicalis]|uniref:NCK-interacting protein with SH3 domain n=1 Tax=Xenopus tropicalis TaxID=8364 RepID=B3DL86_XENTR|nr:NCK-interacting protein with SH3 domain [Xenopus tropicalis]AAI67350.1 nckipsd protein [Xenopus tropicalis]|eukprot:NP_001123414.1 NCK-interacting protein with SH3 domain [Xenopus tropicalis]